MLRANSAQDLDLASLNFIHHKNSFEYIRLLLEGKKQQVLLPLVDARDANANKSSSQLKKIQRRDKWLQEESGSQDLFVGWPFVEGQFLDGTNVRAPLLLFPVKLIEEGHQWQLQLREDQQWVFNKTFQLAFSHFNKIPLANLPEPDPDDFPQNDALIFRTKLFEFLRDNNYTLHFNRELFEDKLLSFSSKTKAELQQESQTGQLKLQPHAVLGIFPYAGSWLVSDYDYLEEKNSSITVEQLFKGTAEVPLAPVKEEQLFTPLPMDGTQEEALRTIRKGTSLVVQGPPGTGKSQLIVNLICDYTARGKKVLVVSQKRAALEVVQNRLKQCGLENFSALVHDLRAERPSLFRQVAEQIHATEEYERSNTRLDTVYLEREYLSACRSIDQALDKLEQFKNALYDTRLYGISAKELYLNTPKENPVCDLSSVSTNFNKDSAQKFSRELSLLLPRVNKLLSADYPLSERKPFLKLSESDLKDIQDGIKLLPEIQKTYIRIKAIHQDINWSDLLDWYGEREALKTFLEALSGEKGEELFEPLKHYLHYKKAEENLLLKLTGEARPLFCKSEKVIPPEELPVLKQHIADAKKILNALGGKLLWKLKGPKEIKQVLKRFQWTPEHIEDLDALILYWETRISISVKFSEHKWLLPLDPWASEEEYKTWEEQNQTLLFFKNLLRTTPKLWKESTLRKQHVEEFTAPFYLLNSFLDQLRNIRVALGSYFHDLQFERWIVSAVELSAISETLRKDVALISETDTMLEELSLAEKATLKLLAQHPNVQPEDFLHSVQHAWLEHLERLHPHLQQTSTGTLDFLEKELQIALQKKEALSLKIVSLRLKEFTYRYAEYNRLQNRTTYRELLHQTTKKKKIWPVRKVVQEFHEELFRLIPCWMASPETVSALFLPEQYFDLVIFDEASQCFTEKGLPAVLRGKQCVIAGDSKQLRPGDLYNVRWEDDSEETIDEEAESLLELAAHYIPQVMLRYHYRSTRNELIDFSNHHFYQQKLDMLPEYSTEKRHALFYHKVTGTWSKQQNRLEAEKVVSLLFELLDKGKKDIGIVTFNFPQAELIQEILEEKVQFENKHLPANLFVKNLENVQGDECDIIIFSVAYAPDEKGKLQLRFGSLNQEDGPNRLNVAITRARKEIHLVCSILPSQLEAERSSQEGPKLLQEYLQYVWDASQGKEVFSSKKFRESASWYLSTRLIDARWKPSSVPLADLQHANQLLITDDDQLYGRSSKEYFGLIPLALQKKGWQYERRYSRNQKHDS